MTNIDYSKLSKITVKNQEELDLIPLDFKGRIHIEFGEYWEPAIVQNKYYYSVVAWENSSVEARGNSSVVARKNSSVVAWENSSVVARENSSVVARENSSVEAWENSSVDTRGNSSVVARENSSVVARENSFVVAWENSSVVAWENSSVEAGENSSVVARENSSVVARENSSVEAWENSSVVAWENSSVVAGGNSSVVARENSSVEADANAQIIDCLQGAKIQISGNARIIYNPRNIHEFMDFYGIKHDKKKATFYKAVHKENGQYYSDYCSSHTYDIQKTVAENCDTNINNNCSHGIHIAMLQWALGYGSNWNNLAILEVETEIKNIVLPKNSNGKVRTSECFIVRELPLEECGLYGKILAKRRKQVETSC